MVPITKNGEPKAALLSDEAVEALKKLPSYGTSEYLFPRPNRIPGSKATSSDHTPGISASGFVEFAGSLAFGVER